MLRNISFFLVFVGLFFFKNTWGQHQELHEKSILWKEKKPHTESDSATLFSAFHHGTFHGHFRNFLMATDNANGLSDYFAEALGGGIKFESGNFRNFKFGMSGFVVFNIHSSNLSLIDGATHQSNRYELGLFDIENPHNKNDIDRLEELYIKFTKQKWQVIAGRQLLNSTFINLQDGRMRPTEVQGISAVFTPNATTKIELVALDEISPRSTVRWFRIGRSIGVYAQGVNEIGARNEYEGNIKSEYVAFGSLTKKVGNKIEFKLLNQYVDRLFNSAFIQSDIKLYQDSLQSISISGQVIRQDVMDNDGYFDSEKRYLEKNGKTWVFSGRLVYKIKKNEISANYTRIADQSQYIMPREWGRDPFFTFLARERNEGLSDVHAYVIKYKHSSSSKRLITTFAGGMYELPDVKEFHKNKYGLPSYYQLLADLRYEFGGSLKGFDAQVLYIYKGLNGNSYDNDRFVINKANMSHYNFVINYHF